MYSGLWVVNLYPYGNTLCVIIVLFSLLKCFTALVWSIFVNVPCLLDKNVPSAVGWCAYMFSHVQLFVTLLSMKFSRQEYWSWFPFPTPGDLLYTGTEPTSLAPPALASRFFTTVPPGKPWDVGWGVLYMSLRSSWSTVQLEGRTPENWCLQHVVLEETPESPLDSKIKPVNLKGAQLWIFTGRTDAEIEAPVFWSSNAEMTYWESPWER